MKRIVKIFLLICLLCILFINPIFAESDTLLNGGDSLVIKVLGEVETESYVAVLYYEDERLLDDVTILDNNNQRFNISEEGRTNEFKIVIEGNEIDSSSLEVTIQGQKFLGILGTRTADVDTGLYVNAIDSDFADGFIPNDNIPFISSLNIPKGIHSETENVVETRFILAWQGNPDLPSGFYASDIDIEYSVVD
jgi:hypothetical protein